MLFMIRKVAIRSDEICNEEVQCVPLNSGVDSDVFFPVCGRTLCRSPQQKLVQRFVLQHCVA